MTAHHTYVITCDNCDTQDQVHPKVRRATAARERAAALGWLHLVVPRPIRSGPSPSLDFCPQCVLLRAHEVARQRIEERQA